MGRMQVTGNVETQDAQHSLWAPPVFPPLAHLDPRLPSPPPPSPVAPEWGGCRRLPTALRPRLGVRLGEKQLFPCRGDRLL